MNLQVLLAVFEQLNPQGFAKFVAEVPVLCADLTLEQKIFIDANLTKLPEWLKTPEGKIAFQTFVQDWQAGTHGSPGG